MAVVGVAVVYSHKPRPVARTQATASAAEVDVAYQQDLLCHVTILGNMQVQNLLHDETRHMHYVVHFGDDASSRIKFCEGSVFVKHTWQQS